MKNKNIKTSAFGLAKADELLSDDFYDVKLIDNLCVAIVCDGVGSAQEGRAAAIKTVTHIMRNFESRPSSWSIPKCIESFIQSVNTILYQESMQNYERVELVTTLAIIVIEGNRLYGANIGDSRVYLYRDEKLLQLSHDHILKEKGYENVLTQAMGIDKNVSPYYFENLIAKDDKILLCSDGLYNVLDHTTIEKTLHLGANLLVKKASFVEDDNIPDDTTAIIVDIEELNQIEILKKQNLEIPLKLSHGDNIDGYILEKALIQNERTWLALKDNEKYILKFAPIEAIEDKKLLDMFVKEAWNSKRIVAEYFTTSFIPETRTYRYYIQNYIEGMNLKNYLKKKKLYVDDVVILGKTLLKMAQFLLKYDLVHGDIKPENIMVIDQGGEKIFKIIDFGSMSEIYSINTKAGTPSYLAPERFEGVSINEGSEIYSIGVVLYEALSSKFPYGEIEPFQTPLFENVKNIDRYNENVPPWLSSIIMRSVSADINKRYKNYSEMLYELEHSKEVKPFIEKQVPFLERNPLLFFKSIALIELIIIIYLLK